VKLLPKKIEESFFVRFQLQLQSIQLKNVC